MALQRRKILKQALSLGYGTDTIPADSGGSLVGDKIGIHTFMGTFLNVKDFGAVGDGSTDDTVAIQTAIDTLGSSPGTVYIPDGTYVITSGLTVSGDRQTIIGQGQQNTIILFTPSATDVALTLAKSTSATIAQNRISGLTFDATGETAQTKTAIEIQDGEEIEINDVAVSNWAETGSRTAVGIRLRGRQTAKLERLTISADNPVRISKNINSGPDADHYHFHNLYLLATSQPNILVDDGVNLTNFTADGYQAWVGGTYGFKFLSTTDTLAAYCVHIANARWEQGTGTTGYGIQLSNLNGFYSVNIVNCYIGSVKGYYLKDTNSGVFIGNTYASTGVALTFAGTIRTLISHNWFNQSNGATLSLAGGTFAGTWESNDQNSRIGIAVTSPTNQLVIPNNTSLAAQNQAGNAEIAITKLSTGDKVQIDPSGGGMYTGGSLFVGSLTLPQSHVLAIANGAYFGVGNAAGTDTLAAVGADSSDIIHYNIGLSKAQFYGQELSGTPGAPSADCGTIYFKDNGAGKTQLCVLFSSGAEQVIATQP